MTIWSSDVLPAGLPAILIGDQATIDAAIHRGYAGGLLPLFSSTKLRLTIEAAAHGLVCTDAPREAMPVLDDEGDAELVVPELTAREGEVLQQLIMGASNKEMRDA
jgi:DNA-binding NarL/FixJ family response regulator